MNKKLKLILGITLVLAVFTAVSFFIQVHLDFFINLIEGYRVLGAIAYVVLSILVIVFAPLTSIPVIPLASALYGWFLAGILSFIGWFIGAVIIFYICRKWGKPVVKNFISLKSVNKLEESISPETKIGGLIFLRFTTPTDLLSYFLGLFTNVSWKVYLFVTFIGTIPGAFILAYLGGLDYIYQLVSLATILLVFLGVVLYEISKDKLKQKGLKHLFSF